MAKITSVRLFATCNPVDQNIHDSFNSNGFCEQDRIRVVTNHTAESLWRRQWFPGAMLVSPGACPGGNLVQRRRLGRGLSQHPSVTGSYTHTISRPWCSIIGPRFSRRTEEPTGFAVAANISLHIRVSGAGGYCDESCFSFSFILFFFFNLSFFWPRSASGHCCFTHEC